MTETQRMSTARLHTCPDPEPSTVNPNLRSEICWENLRGIIPLQMWCLVLTLDIFGKVAPGRRFAVFEYEVQAVLRLEYQKAHLMLAPAAQAPRLCVTDPLCDLALGATHRRHCPKPKPKPNP